MGGNDSARCLPGKKYVTAKLRWLADVADIFVLLCSFLLTTASIVLVILVFNTQGAFAASGSILTNTLSILQRTISAFSVPIVSAVILVAGKRYVFFRLTRRGIRSQRVAVYASPSIGNLARHLVCHGFELPVLALLAVWALGLTTGLTVNDVWTMAPTVYATIVPVGSLPRISSPPSVGGIKLRHGTGLCRVAGSVGLIKIEGDLQLTSGGPMGILYYPTTSTLLNGFNISMEPLSSILPTAQNLICVDGAGLGFETDEGGDNQTLSLRLHGNWQSLQSSLMEHCNPRGTLLNLC